MRTIKFRAWDKENKKIIPWKSMQAWRIDAIQNDSVMQFTGLLDKSGKEIYEGDIVKLVESEFNKDWLRSLPGMTGFVKWVDDGCEYWIEPIWDKDTKFCTRDFLRLVGDEWNGDEEEIESEDVEIIGNIYENPELLSTNQ